MKNVIIKIVVLLMFLTAGHIGINMLTTSGAATVINNELAVAAVNGGNSEYMQWNVVNRLQGNLITIWDIGGLLCLFIVFFRNRKTFSDVGIEKVVPLLVCCLIPFMGSCRKPFQEPVYAEVKNNETAFVIPLEGETKSQAKLNSSEFYEAHKVATKRIQIPTRWNQTGRWHYEGAWIPTMKVIVVDRSPVTRNWEAGTKGTSKDDQAIWIESSDSVGFCMGFNCTAFIKEEDTSSFLYWYSSGSLSNVMDSEIRGRVQQVAATEAAKLPLDKLRDQKNAIADEVRKDIIPFFEKRGITITTVGMFGGMTYENAQIQDSIDKVFVSQQIKNTELAKLDAQMKANERIILEAQGKSTEKQIQVEADAKARLTLAKAEADAISALAKAVADGGSAYLQLKGLEVQVKQAERWDGKLPVITGGVAPLLNAGDFIKDTPVLPPLPTK